MLARLKYPNKLKRFNHVCYLYAQISIVPDEKFSLSLSLFVFLFVSLSLLLSLRSDVWIILNNNHALHRVTFSLVLSIENIYRSLVSHTSSTYTTHSFKIHSFHASTIHNPHPYLHLLWTKRTIAFNIPKSCWCFALKSNWDFRIIY